MEETKKGGLGKKDFILSAIIVLMAIFQCTLILQSAGILDY